MRARLLDPTTSWAAANKAGQFAQSHSERIVTALHWRDMSAAEISERTGLTVVQIDRRLPELQRAGRVAVVRQGGQDLTRDGYRVWCIR